METAGSAPERLQIDGIRDRPIHETLLPRTAGAENAECYFSVGLPRAVSCAVGQVILVAPDLDADVFALNFAKIMQRRWKRGMHHKYRLVSGAVAADLREALSGTPHRGGRRQIDIE